MAFWPSHRSLPLVQVYTVLHHKTILYDLAACRGQVALLLFVARVPLRGCLSIPAPRNAEVHDIRGWRHSCWFVHSTPPAADFGQEPHVGLLGFHEYGDLPQQSNWVSLRAGGLTQCQQSQGFSVLCSYALGFWWGRACVGEVGKQPETHHMRQTTKIRAAQWPYNIEHLLVNTRGARTGCCSLIVGFHSVSHGRSVAHSA